MVIRTNPVDGIENSNDAKYVIGSIEKPNNRRDTKAGDNSFFVDHPSSWNIHKVNIRMIELKKYVRKSKMNDVIQNVDTFKPLTNCRSFALQTLSLI